MTTGTFVLSGRVRDFWTMRTWVERLSKTIASTLVRTKAPDWKKFTVVVPVQFGFTLTVPLRVSLAKPPPTFLASVPETFPIASTLNLTTAAAGTGPGGAGKRIVPVRVAPRSEEHTSELQSRFD